MLKKLKEDKNIQNETFHEKLYNKLLNNIDIAIYDTLYEKYHEVTDFDKCINDLALILSQLDPHEYIGEFYTGWNFNINTQECIQADNEKLYYPIIIKFIPYADKYTKALSDLRLCNIENNKIIINFNLMIYNNYSEIKTILKHEFTHIKEQYANIEFNPLDIPKYQTEKIDNFMSLTNSDFQLIKNILYFINLAEQHAKINELYEIINQKKTQYIEIYNLYKYQGKKLLDTIKFIVNDNEDILKINAIKKIHLILKQNNILCLILGVYLQEKQLLHTGINQENIKTLITTPIIDISIYTNKIINFIEKNINEFIRKIYDIIYNGLVNKK